MTNFLNTKILISAAVILAAAALVVGATFAFFSDSETSTGNTFVAGAIDLQIDNTSYALDVNIPDFENPTGVLVANAANTWPQGNLTDQTFFDFSDLKPGDYGEDTISIHPGSNDAWLCAAARITADDDNTITEPEDEDGDDGSDALNGELDEGINFAFWVDDGDNVLEDDEDETIFLTGPLSGLNPEGKIALADASNTGPFGNTPIAGGEVTYIGKGWCFGAMTATPVAQDDGTDVGRTPLTDGTGFTCNGSAVDNQAQTDSVEGDLQFYAVQSRNNTQFSCATNYTPVWPNQ